MARRVYVAVELTRIEGRGLDPISLAEALEEALPSHVEDSGGYYAIEVLGVGTTMPELGESISRRREARRGMA